jgi:hypothetical protein
MLYRSSRKGYRRGGEKEGRGNGERDERALGLLVVRQQRPG